MDRSNDARVVADTSATDHSQYVDSPSGQLELVMLYVEDLIRRDDILQSLASAGAAHARLGDKDGQAVIEAGVFDAMHDIVANRVVLNGMREAIGKLRGSMGSPAR